MVLALPNPETIMQARKRRIDEHGEKECDLLFDSVEEWEFGKLTYGRSKVADIVSFAFDMKFYFGNDHPRFNQDDLRFLYHRCYHSPIERHAINQIANYAYELADVQEMIADILSVIRDRRWPDWAIREKSNGRRVYSKYTTESFFPPLNGAPLVATGNEEIDKAQHTMHRYMNSQLRKGTSHSRIILEQGQSQLSVISHESKGEIVTKVSAQAEVKTLSSQVEDLSLRMKRLEEGANKKGG